MRKLAAALLGWNLVGYPLMLALLARRTSFPPKTGSLGDVTVLIAAHNESSVIGQRVRNLFETSRLKPEVIVISDGSTDATADIARDAGARVIEQSRAGKIAALHRGVREASGEIIVITDANTRFDDEAIDRLIAPLSDVRVGIAAGDLVFENPEESSSAGGESLYWKYETWIKKNASRAGLLLMGAGGIYAFRRADWPDDLSCDLADDSYVPIALHQKGRINLFVESAKAYERAGTTMREEWRRRVRMTAQDFRVARALAFGLPNPRTFFALISHKVLRWMLFPFAVIVFRQSLIVGVLVSPRFRYLLGASAAASFGMARGLLGRSPAVWDKAQSTRK